MRKRHIPALGCTEATSSPRDGMHGSLRWDGHPGRHPHWRQTWAGGQTWAVARAASRRGPRRAGQDGCVTLAFVRHGQTDWNREGRLQGSSDIPLNETGREQAREAVTMLEAWTWDAVVSSPLARARDTARILADGLGLPLGPAYDELAERDYGPLEGTSSAAAIARWPDRSYPGAEPLDDVVARCLRGLERIDADYPASNVVVVCHGTIMKYTLIRLTGYPVDVVLNGTVSAIERDGKGWRVLTINGEPVTA